MEVEICCPKCRWAPDALSLWECLPVCGCLWNTFSTGGMCPRCGERYEHTQCLSCQMFSPHKDWYHAPGLDAFALEEESESEIPQKVEI
jgi:hypothetical protein